MKLPKPALATAFAISGAMLLAACSSPAGATEIAALNSQLNEIQGAIAQARETLAARGIEVGPIELPPAPIDPIAEPTQVPNAGANLSTVNNAEFTADEWFVVRIFGMSNWLDQQLYSEGEWDAQMANCMAATGQEFRTNMGTSADRESREFAVTYGFEVASRNSGVWANQAVLDSLSERDQQLWWEAHRDCSDYVSQVFNLFWEVGNGFESLRNDVFQVWIHDQRDTAVFDSYFACMSDAGFESTDPDRTWWQPADVRHGLWNLLNEAQNAPIPQELFGNWDWATYPQGPTSPAMAEFIAYEISLATADWDCRDRMNFRDFRNMRNREIIDAALTQFGPELAEWRAAYESARTALSS